MLDDDREIAFAELFRDCYRQLFVYVHALVRNYTDAEDVVQQASLVLWRKFDEYRARHEFPRLGVQRGPLRGPELPQAAAPSSSPFLRGLPIEAGLGHGGDSRRRT